MGAFRGVFTEKHTFLPVIDVTARKQVLRNVSIAVDCDADGVFLTNNSSADSVELIEMFDIVRNRFPDLWIGLNFIDVPNREALSLLPEKYTGLWSDNAGISDSSECDACEFAGHCRKSEWKGLFFGGVGYNEPEAIQDPGSAARRAISCVDVVTTRGPRQGVPPDIERVIAMKSAIGTWPLAVAGGMNADNVKLYAPYVDCFIVARGFRKRGTQYDFDPQLLLSFAKHLDHSPFEGIQRKLAS